MLPWDCTGGLRRLLPEAQGGSGLRGALENLGSGTSPRKQVPSPALGKELAKTG